MSRATSSGTLLSVQRPPPRTPATNLAPESGALLGRERELAAVLTLLAERARLVTVTGLAGVGKTRLVHALAARLVTDVRARPRLDEVWWCELSTASDLDDLVVQLGLALGVPLEGRGPSDDGTGRLIEGLRGRGELLVVLDNLEQLVAHAGVVARLLDGVPGLRVVTTSRIALGLADEQVVELGPLASREAAVALFVERACVRQPGFAARGATREAVEGIVELLDRLPLAIELAAPLVALFDAGALHERLARSHLDVLRVHGGAAADARHASLERALASSWEPLSPALRRALGACAVFVGGFDMAAAEAVIGEAAIDAVVELVGRSLVRREALADGRVRLSLYLGVREFVLRVGDGQARAAAVHRHLLYFGARASAWAAGMAMGSATAALHATVTRERGNLRAALEAALAPESPTAAHDDALDAALGCAHALALDACHREGMRAARAVVERVLERVARSCPGAIPATLLDDREAVLDDTALCAALAPATLGALSDVLIVAARACGAAGHQDVAEALLAQLAQLCERSQDARRLGHVAHERAVLLRAAGAVEAADAQIQIAVRLFERVGAREALAHAHALHGMIVQTGGDHEGSEPYYLLALREAHEQGIELLAAFVSLQLANVAWRRGRLDDARRRMHETLAVQRRYGDLRGEATTRNGLGILALASDDLDAAREHSDAACALHGHVGQSFPLGLVHRHRSLLELSDGQLEAAESHLLLARSLLAGRGGARARVWLGSGEAWLAIASARPALAIEHLERTLTEVAATPLAHRQELHTTLALAAALAARPELVAAQLALLASARDETRDEAQRALERLAALLPAVAALRGGASLEADAAELVCERFAAAFGARGAEGATVATSLELRLWIDAIDGVLPPVLREEAWARALDPEATAVVVVPGASRLRLPQEGWVEMGRRRVVARIVEALIERHRHAPGSLLDRDALLELGWPDERMLPEAANNRLHKTLSMVRGLGLRDSLELVDGEGYRLAPELVVVEVPASFALWRQARRRAVHAGAAPHEGGNITRLGSAKGKPE